MFFIMDFTYILLHFQFQKVFAMTKTFKILQYKQYFGTIFFHILEAENENMTLFLLMEVGHLFHAT